MADKINTENTVVNNGKKNGKGRRKQQRLLVLILLMLLVIAGCLLWLTLRGRDLNEGDRQSAMQTLEQVEQVVSEELVPSDDAVRTFKAAEHIYSHRGSEGEKEHSFEAYDAAIAAGSRYIEQDLVLSSDGVLFVSHDLTAAAMTGDSRAYASMTAEQIDKLETKAGGKVLRMSEVFDRYGDSVTYVIELKAYEDSRMLNAFKELVDKYGYQDRIIVQCMDIHPLRTLESMYPDMTKLYICRSEWGFDTSINEPYIDIISVKDWMMNQDRCNTVHNRGKLFSAWTLDSETQIRNAIDIGVDTYFTNDTPLAISIEKDYGLEKRAGN